MIELLQLNDQTSSLLVNAEVFDNAVDPSQLARFVADAGHILVFARDGKRVLGFASGTVLLHPDKEPAFFVNEVDVLPERQREGIGKALCKQLIELAREKGCTSVWLATEADNTPARALYRSLKGRETDEVVVYEWPVKESD